MPELSKQEKIHEKGFRISTGPRDGYEGPVDYSRIKVGGKTLEDAVLDLGSLKKINRRFADKSLILKALAERNLSLLREISNYFYRSNGIYNKVCNTYATYYRYDWLIAPEVKDEKVKEEKVIDDMTKILDFLDASNLQKVCADISLRVIVDGAYYGYIADVPDRLILQDLPINYCRSRFKRNGMPVVEFDMRYFDVAFKNLQYRMRMLDLFPAEFKKGYMLYRQHKLPAEDIFNTYGSWYMLEPGRAIKFNIFGDDIPIFANAIPSIIDLDAAQDLDRRKQMQQLLKIVIQKLPLDKNGDLIFDLDEAADIHANAVDMLKRAVGVDVLTTFADIDVANMADKNTTATQDDLAKMERTVYNALGITKNLFNTDGNLAMQQSIANDAGIIRDLILQYEHFLDIITSALTVANRKKYLFRFYMLQTTQYNYQELSKMYKEQTQIGFSKMLPQIAMGHSQSFIINTAHFENEVLHLSDLMLPPLQSSTLNAEGLQALSGQNTGNGKTGRPKKDDSQKAEKTIQNQESQG